ncbi:EF-hand domain-containing protein [uncultured Algimonas sp.]|uniref:EF-hand domain-containing protein n=1 Tax=uncultured Algimonas sp. TaxID=1547920 RepID=UPI00261EDFD5|nr:EF-hand domain-containing protein [uncultured Algimonas sp.]
MGNLDADGDGYVSFEELQASFPSISEDTFAAADTDADGRWSDEEFQAFVDMERDAVIATGTYGGYAGTHSLFINWDTGLDTLDYESGDWYYESPPQKDNHDLSDAKNLAKVLEAIVETAKDKVSEIKIGDRFFKTTDVLKALKTINSAGDVADVLVALNSGSAENVINALGDIIVGAGVIALTSPFIQLPGAVVLSVAITQEFELYSTLEEIAQIPGDVTRAIEYTGNAIVSFDQWLLNVYRPR